MFKKLMIPFLFASMLVIFSGCSTIEASSVSPEELALGTSNSEPPKVTKLAPGNTLELSVEVAGKTEVSFHRATINHADYVTLPLVGDVKVGGLYLGGARNLIKETYAGYFVDTPVVMLGMVDDPADGEWGFVTVTGRVAMPGRVKISSSKGIKLTAAIQEAGGFAGSAKKTEIRISRVDESGRKIRVTVNYEDIGQKGSVEADVDLRDGDIIYVPERIF